MLDDARRCWPMVTASSLPFYFKFYLRPRFLDENKVYVALLFQTEIGE